MGVGVAFAEAGKRVLTPLKPTAFRLPQLLSPKAA